VTVRSGRLTRVRWSIGVIVVLLAMGLTACSNPDRQPSSARIPTGCGDCEAEIDALVRSIEETPGVRAVTTTRRTTKAVPQAYLRVGLSVVGEEVVSTDITSVLDAVAEAAWRSEVTPLDVLVLDVTLAGGYAESDRLLFGADRDVYEKRWGARPEGSEWSPVPEEQAAAAGCERDGCPDLMRDIAEQVSSLPGVEAVVGAAYIADTPTNSSSADVAVRTDGTDVSEAVAEIVWRSQVAPLTLISVTADRGDDSVPDSTTFQIDPDVGRDHDRLEEQWGARPVGG
jgi:hypothetical protein